MQTRNRNTVMAVIAVFIAIFAAFLFFRPLPFSAVINEQEDIFMSHTQFGVKDGVPTIDSSDFTRLKPEQKSAVVAALAQCSYQRSLQTIFSDGALSGAGSDIVYLYTYENEEPVHSIILSGGQGVCVDGKTYRMRNADALIRALLVIFAA